MYILDDVANEVSIHLHLIDKKNHETWLEIEDDEWVITARDEDGVLRDDFDRLKMANIVIEWLKKHTIKKNSDEE